MLEADTLPVRDDEVKNAITKSSAMFKKSSWPGGQAAEPRPTLKFSTEHIQKGIGRMERLAKVSLQEKFAAFSDLWSPKIVAKVDDFAVKLVKVDGEFVWHHHAEADEVFLVIRGGIRMRYRIGEDEDDVWFGPGELLRVPRGVEHMPIADPGTQVVLFERADLVNTGNVRSERTAASARL